MATKTANSSFMDVLADELRKDLRTEVRAEILAEFGLDLEPSAGRQQGPATSPAVSARERLELWLSAKFGAKKARLAKVPRAYAKSEPKARNEMPKQAANVTPKAQPAPEPRVKHDLDAEDRAALEFFRREGQRLADDYTENELKTAYRKLALKFHPDTHAAEDELGRRRWAARFQQLADVTERLGRHLENAA